MAATCLSTSGTAMSRTAVMSRLLCRTRLDRLARLSWRGLLILNYHRIGVADEFDDADLFSATVDEFDEQVAALAARFDIVAAGSTDLRSRRPARRVAITLDDGYRDQLQAAQVLHSHGVPASFFICTGFVDSPRHAWWDEIAWLMSRPSCDLPPAPWMPSGLQVAGRAPDEVRRAVNAAFRQNAGANGEEFLEWLAARTGRERLPVEQARGVWMRWDDVKGLLARGMEVGGHSVSHAVLSTLDPDEQRAEIAGSMTRLRTELDTDLDTFAYPVGTRTTFNSTTRTALAEAGVRRAFSFFGGINRPGRTDPYDVARAAVSGGDSVEVVQATAALPMVLASARRHT